MKPLFSCRQFWKNILFHCWLIQLFWNLQKFFVWGMNNFNFPFFIKLHQICLILSESSFRWFYSMFYHFGFDFFRSNFLRLCVLKAIQSSRKHLDKIFNVDEFCRRFFAVIHSNDPIARSVTLRFVSFSPKKNLTI